jgi:putative ABC transport system permease protein
MPNWKKEIRRYLRPLRLSAEREMEIVDELAAHLEDRYAEFLVKGQSEDEAFQATIFELRDSEMFRREMRRSEPALRSEPIILGARRMNMFSDLWQDLRYGLRMLRKHPGFSLVAVLTLALGIGANTAIFSVASAVLLRSLPYQEPERLVHPVSVKPAQSIERGSIPYADFADWRDESNLFERIAIYQRATPTITDGDEPERVTGVTVSEGYFDLMKVGPILGRAFRPEDHKPGAEPVVIIGQGLWQRRYGSASDIVGRTIRLGGAPYTIVGVVAQDSVWPAASDLWVPINFGANPSADLARRDNMVYQAVARLKMGVTLAQAKAQVAVMAERIAQQYPEARRGWSMNVIPLQDYIVGPQLSQAILVLLGAVVFMLLIACANVANLLLARAATREREIAIRTALGARRFRIMRQLLTESLLLAALGGTLGLALGSLGLKALIAAAPDGIPRLETISIDGRVLGFTLLTTLATALFFGLLPALNVSKTGQSESLKEGARGASGSRQTRRLRNLLVAAEIAISIVLLIGAGLMSKSFIRLQNADPGVNVNNVLTFRLALPRTKYPQAENVADFYRRLEERLRAMPGVEGVATTSKIPIGGTGFGLGRVFLREGQPEPPASTDFPAQWNVITPAYFKTIGIPLIKGRYFTEQDKSDSNQVIIISQNMARRLFPNEDPLGKRIRSWRDENKLREIIGVVGDVRYFGLEDDQRSLIYVPHAQDTWSSMMVAVRTSADPLSVVGAVRREVKALEPILAVGNIATMTSVRDNSLAESRFNALLLVIFAIVAMMLAAIGIYGVMAYSVTQRTREIGIRLALGAERRDVINLVLGQGVRLTLIGVTIGLLGAVAATRALTGLLYGVSTTDPATFIVISLFIAVVALIACYVPARRATQVDPLVALRCD